LARSPLEVFFESAIKIDKSRRVLQYLQAEIVCSQPTDPRLLTVVRASKTIDVLQHYVIIADVFGYMHMQSVKREACFKGLNYFILTHTGWEKKEVDK
jgi:hypothetical protein